MMIAEVGRELTRFCTVNMDGLLRVAASPSFFIFGAIQIPWKYAAVFKA